MTNSINLFALPPKPSKAAAQHTFERAPHETIKEEEPQPQQVSFFSAPTAPPPATVPLSLATRFKMGRVIEALLFASCEPLSFDKLRQIVEQIAPIKPRELRAMILQLQTDYYQQQRSFRLEEIAEGFVLRSSPEFAPYIEMMVRQRRSERLSQAAAEVLAIIAYKQPITRPQIDSIRGVDSSGTLQNLIERGLIVATGRLEAPGRPTLYAITPTFLKHFGLRTLEELPTLPLST